MATLRNDGDNPWPERLAEFRAGQWGPVPGGVLEACRCPDCTARHGAALPPDTSITVAAARRRWRQARISYAHQKWGKGSRYRRECFQMSWELTGR